MNAWLDRCHFGDVRSVLCRMIADGVKVNTIVTSPPYWGLRSYLPADHPEKHLEIGSEPTFGEFLHKMVGIFELCRQVLRDDGTMWVNMGDSYAGSRSGPDTNSTLQGSRRNQNEAKRAKQAMTASRRRDDHPVPRSDVRMPGFKPKDMVGQPHRLAFALQDAGWWLRQDIVWHKPNPMPESTRDRCTKAHEFIFLLAKSERYYYDFEAMQEPVEGSAHARTAGTKHPAGWATGDTPHTAAAHQQADAHRKTKVYAGNGVGFGHGFDTSVKPRVVGLKSVAPKEALEQNDSAYGEGKSERMGRGAGWRDRKLAAANSGTKNNDSMDAALTDMVSTRNRRSVWTVPSAPYKGAHFATFPPKLIEPCVLAGCPAGGTVLDIFFGSGTTGQVAQALGRHFIGIDIDRRNDALQIDRLRQPSLMLESA